MHPIRLTALRLRLRPGFAPLALLALLPPIAATAADWKPLTGTYAVTAEHYLDPGPDKPTNSHFRLQLTGDAARDLFEAIPGKATVDECTGGQSKTAGQLRCTLSADDGGYECAFSVDLIEHTVEYGVAC